MVMAGSLQIELAGINIQKDIADAQAEVLSEALKSAKIDIVGGEQVFFDKIIGAITQGKSMDRTVDNSAIYSEIKGQLLDPNGKSLVDQVRSIFQESGLKTDDIKNLSVAVFLNRLMQNTEDPIKRGSLQQMLEKSMESQHVRFSAPLSQQLYTSHLQSAEASFFLLWSAALVHKEISQTLSVKMAG